MYPPNAPYPPQPPQYNPGYAQPQYQPQVPQGYAPPPVAPVGPPPAKGTVAGFFSQPVGGGGPGFKFMVVGTTYQGTIARDVTDADVSQQTDYQTKTITPSCFYRDGRPKLQMCIPILLAQGPSAEFPEGAGAWYVKGGADQQELVRAMQAAGAVPDENGVMFPKAGDLITITYTHDKPGKAGMNPSKIKSVQYQVGNGQAPAAPVAAPVQQVAQQAFSQVMQPTQYQNPQGQPVQQPQYAPQPQVQQYAPTPQVSVLPQIPGLTPEQAALVAAQHAQQQQG
jgi:hypothetical protein